MGSDAGNNGNNDLPPRKGSIAVSNYTDKKITISAVVDAEKADGERKKTVTIDPRDSYLFFTDRFEAISWEKSK